MAALGDIAAVVVSNLTQAYAAPASAPNDFYLQPSAPVEPTKASTGSMLVVSGPGGAGVTTVNTPARYAVAGNVKDSEVNVARTVRAYRRDNGILLGSTVSDAGTGNFSIPIESYNGLVFVVAFDDENAPILNAKINDRVIPV